MADIILGSLDVQQFIKDSTDCVDSCLRNIDQSRAEVEKLASNFVQQHELALSFFVLQLSAKSIVYDRSLTLQSACDLGNKMEEVSKLMSDYLLRDNLPQQVRTLCQKLQKSLAFHIKYTDGLREEYSKLYQSQHTGWFGWCIKFLSWCKWIHLCWVLRYTSKYLLTMSEQLIPVFAVDTALLHGAQSSIKMQYQSTSRNLFEGDLQKWKLLDTKWITVFNIITALTNHEDLLKQYYNLKQCYERVLVQYQYATQSIINISSLASNYVNSSYVDREGVIFLLIKEKLDILISLLRQDRSERVNMLKNIDLDIMHSQSSREIEIYKKCVYPIVKNIELLKIFNHKINTSSTLLSLWYRFKFNRQIKLLEQIMDKCRQDLIALGLYAKVRDDLNDFYDLVSGCRLTNNQQFLFKCLQNSLLTFQQTFKQKIENLAVPARDVLLGDTEIQFCDFATESLINDQDLVPGAVETAKQEGNNNFNFLQLLQEAEEQACIAKLKPNSTSSYSVLFDKNASLNV